MAAAAAAVAVGWWWGQREGVFTDPESGLEAAGSRSGDLGSLDREARPLSALVGQRPLLSRLPPLKRARALGGSRAQGHSHPVMTSLLEEVTEPNGALSPGPGDTEGRSPPSPRDLLASEDLEMFVLDLEDYDLWESIRGELSPMAGGPACE